MENPIKENRIVYDKTFAIRLISFVSDVKCACSIGDEEKYYILSVANKLLEFQKHTLKNADESEKQYFINIES